MIDLLIVNHRTAAECVALLATVPEGFRALVLENGSGSNDREALAGAPCELDVSEENLGFARGVNRLARRARAEWLLLLNPDVVPAPGVLAGLAARLPPAPIAILGGERTGPGPRAHGRFPGLLDRFRRVDATAAGPVDWVSGCFMLLRRAVFEELGGFDEGYFMQLEDVDLCWRARRRGHLAAVDPALTFAHRGHLSYARAERSLARDYRAGKARFLERTGRPVAAAVLRAAHSLFD